MSYNLSFHLEIQVLPWCRQVETVQAQARPGTGGGMPVIQLQWRITVRANFDRDGARGRTRCSDSLLSPGSSRLCSETPGQSGPLQICNPPTLGNEGCGRALETGLKS